MVNQSEVAKLANVSFITVSRVINNKGNVKEETRKRVLDAVEKLGYHPSSLGRALSSNKMNILGMRLRGEISNDFLSDLLSGIEMSCKKQGYSLLLDFADETSELQSFFERKVDGLILFLSDLSSKDIELIEKNKIPAVVLWDKVNSKEIISVYPDDAKGGFVATEHLIELGHTKIVHVCGKEDNQSSRDRKKGYLQAMAKHNIKVDNDFLIQGEFTYESGKKVGHEIINLQERPTAVFCSSDLIAFGLLDAFRHEGIKVPEDISVVGYDAGAGTLGVYCPLTSVYNPVREVGMVGSTALINKINGKKTDSIINDFETRLAIRKSTCRNKA